MRGEQGRVRRSVVGLAALAGLVAVTAPLLAPAGTPLGPQPSAAQGLTPFSDCAELRRWYVRQALPDVTAYGWRGHPYYGVFDQAIPVPASAPVPRAQEAVSNGATGTNVQEAGVDEPDLAKTNGDIVVTVPGRDLVITSVSGTAPTEVGRLTLPRGFGGYELLLVGDRIVVLGTQQSYYRDVVMWGSTWPGSANGRSAVITVDVADPAAPSVIASIPFEGTISTAREHDGTVRVVASSTPSLNFVHPNRRRDRLEARQRNREIVRSTRAQDWLPQRDVDRRSEGGSPLLGCSDVTRPDTKSGLGTITVLTLDPNADAEPATTAVAASGDLVYASTDRLYVATQAGWQIGWDWRRDVVGSRNGPETEIHAFDSTGDATTYVASGRVPGIVPDRWAFSEYDGRLRVASMRSPAWQQTDTVVSVLEEDDGVLRRIGHVGGMGVGEEIKSVRWFGELAVIVTFRQTDPLYTLDLSSPRDPQVLGELKITGFSEYLHPLGDDLLLGVGLAADRRGMTRGSQVSVFDLTDLSAPSLVDRLGLGRRSSSPVEYDSRAFTYLPEQRLALVPATAWRRDTTRIEVLQVSPDGDLSLVRTLPVSGDAQRLTRAAPR